MEIQVCEKIADIPENYYAADYDVSNFDEITVPSNWQIEGYGRPQYLNIRYPHALETKIKSKIPHVKEDEAPAGLYVLDFECQKTTTITFLSISAVSKARAKFTSTATSSGTAKTRSTIRNTTLPTS